MYVFTTYDTIKSTMSIYNRTQKKLLIWTVPLALFLGICFIYGDYSYREADFAVNVVTVLEILFFSAVYCASINLLYYFVCFRSDNRIKQSESKFLLHPFLYTFIILTAFWSFHLILKYPAANTTDSMGEIRIDEGIVGISGKHPVFHALVFNAFLKIGLLFGDINIGAFLAVFAEMLLRAVVLSYSIVFLTEIKAPHWSIIATIVFYAVSPYVTGFIGLVSKDACCTDFIVLFTVLLGYYLYDSKNFFSSKKKLALFIVSAVFTSLFRNNGIICIVPVLLVILVRELKRSKCARNVLILVLAIALPIVTKSGLSLVLKAEKMDLSEALSIPFQQTARFVIYHGDLVTEEEKEIISKILPYDELPRLYNEVNSDPVKSKATTGKYFSTELQEYLMVWFKLFFKSPKCYFDTVLKQSIYLFYPFYQNFTNYSVNCNSEYYMYFRNWFTTPESIKVLQPYYREFLSYQHSFAPLAFINSMAFYVILLLTLVVFSLCIKDWKTIFLMFPGIIVIIEAFFAANISANARYIFPVIWSSGIYLSFFAMRNRKNVNNTISDKG